jgi:hypothetical protein
VADPLPAGLRLVHASPSQGFYNARTGIWTVGTLANGATAVLRITAKMTASGQIVNNAVARADQFDPNPANNMATASVRVQMSPDQVSKQAFLASTAAGHPTVNPVMFSRNEQFVAQVYLDQLHRQPDALGMAMWTDFLDNGGSRSQAMRGIESSAADPGDEVNGDFSRVVHGSIAGLNKQPATRHGRHAK